eukprot:gene7836-5467_t
MCVCVEPQQRVVLKRCHMDTFIRSTACAIQMLRRCSAALAGAVPMNLGRLNHVAIAVPKNQDLTKAADMYKNVLGAKVSAPLSLPEHGVITVFLELLHPIGDKSPIQGFLDKNPGGGMHHICLETADLQASIEQVKAAKIRAIGQPKIGAHGNPVIFLHPKDCGGVLVELEERYFSVLLAPAYLAHSLDFFSFCIHHGSFAPLLREGNEIMCPFPPERRCAGNRGRQQKHEQSHHK